MNTMQAVMRMLEGKIVHCQGWYAIIERGKLLIADNKKFKNKKEFVDTPIFHGHFVKETNNKDWDVYDPSVLKLGDLKPGEKFKFVGDKVHNSHLTHMVIEDNGYYKCYCLNTFKTSENSFNMMKDYEVEKVT